MRNRPTDIHVAVFQCLKCYHRLRLGNTCPTHSLRAAPIEALSSCGMHTACGTKQPLRRLDRLVTRLHIVCHFVFGNRAITRPQILPWHVRKPDCISCHCHVGAIVIASERPRLAGLFLCVSVLCYFSLTPTKHPGITVSPLCPSCVHIPQLLTASLSIFKFLTTRFHRSLSSWAARSTACAGITRPLVKML